MITSPVRRPSLIKRLWEVFGVSEQRLCRAIEQLRSSQQYIPQIPNRDVPLMERIVDLAARYGRTFKTNAAPCFSPGRGGSLYRLIHHVSWCF